MLLNSDELLPEDRIEYFSRRAKRRNKRTRLLAGKHKLLKLYRETGNRRRYWSSAYFDEDKNRIISYSLNNSQVRKQCERRFRRKFTVDGHDAALIGNGASYRRFSEYRWTVI